MKKIHKGWIILIFIIFTVAAFLGFGRFAFGAIIPFMKDGLGLDYRQTGIVASAIFLGYLLSVSVVGFFVMRFGTKKVIIISLFIISFGMAISGFANGFWMAYIGCLLAGIGTGGANVPSLELVGRWFTTSMKGMAIGIANSGAGIGMAVTGFFVPVVIATTDSGWRISWFILAFLVAIVAVVNLVVLKQSPEEAGLKPIGKEYKSPVSNSSSPTPELENRKKEAKRVVFKNKLVWAIGLIYGLWGFSYVNFSTFLVDYLMKDLGYDKELAGSLFAVIGFSSIISGFLWGTVSDRFGRMYAVTIVLFIQFVMLIGITITSSPVFVFIEVLLYGITLVAVPTIMIASVADFIEVKYISVAMGFITLFFSIGQFISPIVTGYIISFTGKYFIAFLLSAALNLIGAAGCIKLHFKQKKSNMVVESS